MCLYMGETYMIIHVQHIRHVMLCYVMLCGHVFVHMHMNLHMCMYLQQKDTTVCVHTCMCKLAYMYTHADTHTHLSIYLPIYLSIYIYVHTCACTWVYTYVYTCMWKHIRACRHTVCMCVWTIEDNMCLWVLARVLEYLQAVAPIRPPILSKYVEW